MYPYKFFDETHGDDERFCSTVTEGRAIIDGGFSMFCQRSPSAISKRLPKYEYLPRLSTLQQFDYQRLSHDPNLFE